MLSISPVAGYLILLAATICILGGLTHRWTNFLLFGLHASIKLLSALLSSDSKVKHYLQELARDIPKDIRTIQSRLQLSPPPSTTYATCPEKQCSATYAPDSQGHWPSQCDNNLPDGSVCHSPLLTAGVNPYPRRPYVLYDIKHLIAEIISVEPTSTLLRFQLTPEDETKTDIFEGEVVREFLGPVRGPKGTRNWFDAPDDEARLLFTLSIDWMNPFGVKAAGVAASVGVIALCCLNLPISARYKPENLILLGLIPGPHEPLLESLNNFTKPIVEDFLTLWHQGIVIKFEDSAAKCCFKSARAAIIGIVTDLPASKKITGNTSHNSDIFCTRCKLHRLDMKKLVDWPERTCKESREAAFLWYHGGEAVRTWLEDTLGIRFSEFVRLPYLIPQKHAVFDIMHGLFLGVTKRHCLHILGMSDEDGYPGGKHLYEERNEAKVRRGREILNGDDVGSMSRRLNYACDWADLYSLCEECRVPLKLKRSRNKKKSMIDGLIAWVRSDF